MESQTSSFQLPNRGNIQNFKLEEDICLAKAYITTSMDASIATDQNGDTFWAKIAEKFQSLVGEEHGTRRNATSLKNRWNGHLAKACSKFTGCLTNSLKRFRSGWSYDDYVTEAKRLYRLEVKKDFTFEFVYNIVKNLPKFAVDPHSMSPQVVAALNLDAPTGELRERPDIGKKAAKKRKFDAEKHQKETSGGDERTLAINRLAKATEEKTKVIAYAAEEKAKILFFNSLPDSAPEKQRFIALQAAKYFAQEEANIANQRTNHSENTSTSSRRPPLDLNLGIDLSSDSEDDSEI
jgi:hypothetical protein